MTDSDQTLIATAQPKPLDINAELAIIGRKSKKKKDDVDLQQAFLVLGKASDVKPEQALEVRRRLEQMGVDPLAIEVLHTQANKKEHKEKDKKEKDKTKDSTDSNSSANEESIVVRIRGLKKQFGGQGITHSEFVKRAEEQQILKPEAVEKTNKEAKEIKMSFRERWKRDGFGKAFGHAFSHFGLEMIGWAYIGIDLIAMTYGELLAQNKLEEDPYRKIGLFERFKKTFMEGDRLFGVTAFSASIAMAGFGTDTTGLTSEDREINKLHKAMEKDPFGKVLTMPDKFALNPQEEMQAGLTARAGTLATGLNAASCYGLYQGAVAYSKAQGQLSIQRWGQTIAAGTGFTVATIMQEVSRESIDGALNSNFLTRMIRGPVMSTYDFLEERKTATVAFVLLHNSLGAWTALQNKDRSKERNRQTREDEVVVDKDSGYKVSYKEERFQPITDFALVDGKWTPIVAMDDNGKPVRAWWDIFDKEAKNPLLNRKDARQARDNALDLFHYRKEGWVVKEIVDGKTVIRSLSNEERDFIQTCKTVPTEGRFKLLDVKDEQGNDTINNLHDTNPLYGQGYIKLAISDTNSSGVATRTVEILQLEAHEKVEDRDKFFDKLKEYDDNRRMSNYWLPYFIQNVSYALFCNGPLAFVPRPSTAVNPETMFSRLANELLDASAYYASSDSSTFITQTLGRLDWQANHLAEQREINYALRKGLIEVRKDENLADAIKRHIVETAQKLAPYNGKLEAWKVFDNVRCITLNPEGPQAMAAMSAGVALNHATQVDGHIPPTASREDAKCKDGLCTTAAAAESGLASNKPATQPDTDIARQAAAMPVRTPVASPNMG